MYITLLFFILLTFGFFIVIGINKNNSRCNGNGECFDGNGYYQYLGRGDKNESIDVLLSRIDWLAKNSCNGALYTSAYIISYAILLAIILILYAYSKYIISVFEMVLIFSSCFITIFSILNLLQFHTDKYPNYYIRKNIEHIAKNYNITISDPLLPVDNKLPHRTEVQDVLSK